MMRASFSVVLWFCFGLLSISAHAVQPDEILQDPILETRAREISSGLRCLVCQNQSIDDSDASVARDLRILIREQLQQSKTNGEVVDYIVARYGDYVLLKPRLTSHTALLWFAPFAILLGCAALLLRRRAAPNKAEQPLSEAEKAELAELIRK